MPQWRIFGGSSGNVEFVLWPVLIVVAVVVLIGVPWYRRRQARRTAEQLGGQVTSGVPAAGWRPGLPDPVSAPATGSGTEVQVQVCGRPALLWQQGGGPSSHGVRLSLLVEYGAGLPVLTMVNHSRLAQAVTGSTDTGIEAVDRAFRTSGELQVWGPILAMPAVQQALLAFPLNSVSVFGGRVILESLDGVHLEPRASEGLVAVATALVSAIPPSVTSAGPTPSPGASLGPVPTDAEAVVRQSLASSGLSPQQQDAMMEFVRATRQRRA